jgi:hypothetical protein
VRFARRGGEGNQLRLTQNAVHIARELNFKFRRKLTALAFKLLRLR